MGLSVTELHSNLQRQTAISDTIIRNRLEQSTPMVNVSTATMVENIAYGLLSGMSYELQTSCNVGLQNTIYSASQIVNQVLTLNPLELMNIGISSTSLSSAVGSVYA